SNSLFVQMGYILKGWIDANQKQELHNKKAALDRKLGPTQGVLSFLTYYKTYFSLGLPFFFHRKHIIKKFQDRVDNTRSRNSIKPIVASLCGLGKRPKFERAIKI